jgi:hypothetical protein
MSLLFGLLALALHGDKAKPDLPPICIRGVATQELVVALTFDACATRKQANGFEHAGCTFPATAATVLLRASTAGWVLLDWRASPT